MKFAELDINENLKKAIADANYETLTPIQEQSLSPALEGRDIAGVAQTGTGKTAAFLIPILQRIMSEEIDSPSALIVAPTRELCLQIAEEATRLSKYHQIKVTSIYGGESYNRQESELAANPDIIVATPGRLIDYLKQGKVKTDNLRFLVLDEADRMFDMGFVRDIRFIMKKVPTSSQTMLYSATLSYYVLRLASDYMKDPVEVRIESETVAIDKIDQNLYHLGRDEKQNYLANLLLEQKEIRAIVFTNLKTMTTTLANKLRRYGIPAVGISSMLEQKKRIRLLKDFKLGKYDVLVATDVASRGIDVDGITHVFNFDLPGDAESYVHRIGRTARAGKSGTSISFCSEADYENLPRIQRFLGTPIKVAPINEEYLKEPQGEFVALPMERSGEVERRDKKREPRDKDRRRRDRQPRRSAQSRFEPARSEPRQERGQEPEQGKRRVVRTSSEHTNVRDLDRAALLQRTAAVESGGDESAGRRKRRRSSGGRRRQEGTPEATAGGGRKRSDRSRHSDRRESSGTSGSRKPRKLTHKKQPAKSAESKKGVLGWLKKIFS